MEGGKPAVLIVDDTEANLTALAGVLGSMDCELFAAHSGDEALRLLLRHPFAVMLLDARMPGMDGFEVARFARSNPATRNVPIIFLTAMQPSREVTREAYGSGAIDFMSKPVDAVVLRNKIAVFLELELARRRVLAAQAQTHELEAARRVAESRRALLEELTHKNAELARANVELEQFAYIVSHDLREPLRMISTFVDLLSNRQRDRLDVDGRKYLDHVADGSRRLRELVDGLLTFTGVQRDDAAHGAVNMNELVDETLADVREELETARGVAVRESLPVVVGSSEQLSQLMGVLVDNALAFSGREPPRIEIEAAQDGGDRWVFSVRDHGIGIEHAFMERAFQLFQAHHPDSTRSRAGVGLAIARRIVHNHGGRIWAESTPGEGATFRFTLPAHSPS